MRPQPQTAVPAPPVLNEGAFVIHGLSSRQHANGAVTETVRWRHTFADGSGVSGRTIRRSQPFPPHMTFSGFPPSH